MTTNTREEKLRFIIEGKGDDTIVNLAKEIEKIGKSGEVAEEELGAFADELDRLARIDRSITALTKLKVSLAETGTNLDRARVRVDELEKEFAQAEKPTAKLSKQLDAARAAVDQLSKQQNRQTAELNRNSTALRAAGVDTEKLGSAQRQVRQDITNLSDRFGRYSTQLREAGAGAERAAKGTRDLGTAAKSANTDLAGVELGLGKIAAAAGAAVAALKGIQFGAGLLTDATALQGQLAEVQAIAGASSEQFAQLRAAAEGAAADTGIAIEQVTAGLGELARAGFETQDTIAALRPALDLAQAGSLALSDAVEITTTTLTQFGEGADQAGRVADVLASAANSTQSSVEGLGRALTDVAPLSRQLDISLEETVAILGRLADEGFRGSRAGTSLRSAFAQLLDPSSKFREELNKLGITSTDFTTVLEELATKGDAGRNALLSLGQEAAPAILALAGKGGSAIRALTADLQGAAGEASLTAQAIRDTLGNAFIRLEETGGNAVRKLIDPLLKPLQGLLETIIARLSAFANSEDFAKIRDGLAEAFTNGIELLKQLVESADFSRLAAEVQNFAATSGESLAGLKQSIDSIAAAFEAVGASVRILVTGVKGGITAVQSNFVQLQRLTKEAELALLRYSSLFQDNAEFQVRVQGEINALIAEQARLDAEREPLLRSLESATNDFADAFSRIGPQVQALGEQTGPIDTLVNKIKEAANTFGLIAPEVQQAAGAIQTLPEVVQSAAVAVEVSNTKAAGSFELIASASDRVKVATLRNFEELAASLEQKANDIALQIARAVESGADSSALQRELNEVENKLADTRRQVESTRASLGALNTTGRETAGVFNGISGAAGGAASALRGVEQAAGQTFGNIGQGASTVTGGPLAAMNAEFGRLRDAAAQYGDAALEAFDATLRVGDQFKGTGFTVRSLFERQAASLELAKRTVDELGAAYGNSANQAERLARASGDAAQNAALALEAEQQRNLEIAKQLLEVEKERAGVQQASVTALTQQVGLTRELASTRENLPPQKIELIAANRQKPGELLGEIGEPAIQQIAQEVVRILGLSSRGITGQRFRI